MMWSSVTTNRSPAVYQIKSKARSFIPNLSKIFAILCRSLFPRSPTSKKEPIAMAFTMTEDSTFPMRLWGLRHDRSPHINELGWKGAPDHKSGTWCCQNLVRWKCRQSYGTFYGAD